MLPQNDLSNQREIVKRLMKVSTAALSDIMEKVGISSAMDSGIKPLCPGLKIAGPALTINRIRKPQNLGTEDFKEFRGMTLPQTVDSARAGDVIVMSAEKETEGAAWGGNMSMRAKVINVAGVVLDCGLRDSQEIIEMGFPVFARSIFPRDAFHKITTIGINVPVVCGGILVHPGDMIVGDNDGVVVIPRERLEEILKMAEELEEIEKRSLQYLKEGHTLVEATKKFKIS